jgi:hypothetical protein
MIKRIANPYHLSTLFNLLLVVQPDLKIRVVKILRNVTKTKVPSEVFEAAVALQTRNEESFSWKIVSSVRTTVKFPNSKFLQLMYNYLKHIREQMWSNTGAESDGMYAVSQVLSDFLRDVMSGGTSQWASAINSELKKALLNLKALTSSESDIVVGLLPGGEYKALVAGDLAVTDKGDSMTVLGYSENWIDNGAVQTDV